MHPVPLTTTKRIADYAEIIGEQRYAELRTLAAAAAGRSIVHINATAFGGGVAEILQNLVPLLRDVGVDARWAVLDAPPAFYDVTKKMHNALQGMPLTLSDPERRLFLEVSRENAAQLELADVVLDHDPQAVGLRHFATAPERAGWVWRCHIDLTTAHEPVWSFLRSFVEEHDASIWTMPQFVRPGLRMKRVLIQAPTIDPLSEKNREMPIAEARDAVRHFGVDVGRPILLQVSRFDPWKDPLGVIDAYRVVKAEVKDVQLVMIGSLADDDPEGIEYLERTRTHAGRDPDIFLLTNLDGVRDRQVNAFQRSATVVVQKSLREGFGLVVAEALWKGIPVVGGKVGGIVLQIEDGVSGFLVSSVDECAERCLELLRDPGLRRRMAAVGREHVRENFLITRDLRDQLQLVSALAGSGARP
ncbi:MAG TPA: glycosyltransferase [Candidatus Limnocylindria bacterium]|jgi:trehalose synthase|nr:glycosyltransferase [Candidatus Limnocylindria bacterium]